jgi:hypothetical protein
MSEVSQRPNCPAKVIRFFNESIAYPTDKNKSHPNEQIADIYDKNQILAAA